MQSSTQYFSTDDHHKIFVYEWLPEAGVDIRGVVLIVHGMAEHAGRYVGTAKALTDAGYAVFAHDHRGHGKSIHHENDVGFFAPDDGWNRVVKDVHQLTQHYQARYPGKPFVLLGHSMGSFMCQQLMYEHGNDYAAVILSGSNGSVGFLRVLGVLVTRLELLRLGERGKSALVHQMSFADFNRPFKPNRTDFDWLSRDNSVVDAYIADPRCGFRATVSLWHQFLIGLGEIERPSNQAHIPRNLPVYIVSGALDPVSKASKGLLQLIEAYRIAGLTRVTHRFYPGARHEILNETNKEDVYRDMISWLDAQLATSK